MALPPFEPGVLEGLAGVLLGLALQVRHLDHGRACGEVDGDGGTRLDLRPLLGVGGDGQALTDGVVGDLVLGELQAGVLNGLPRRVLVLTTDVGHVHLADGGTRRRGRPGVEGAGGPPAGDDGQSDEQEEHEDPDPGVALGLLLRLLALLGRLCRRGLGGHLGEGGGGLLNRVAAGEAMTEVAGDQESAAGAATDMPWAAACRSERMWAASW